MGYVESTLEYVETTFGQIVSVLGYFGHVGSMLRVLWQLLHLSLFWCMYTECFGVFLSNLAYIESTTGYIGSTLEYIENTLGHIGSNLDLLVVYWFMLGVLWHILHCRVFW